jgi:hypothetical protein
MRLILRPAPETMRAPAAPDVVPVYRRAGRGARSCYPRNRGDSRTKKRAPRVSIFFHSLAIRINVGETGLRIRIDLFSDFPDFVRELEKTARVPKILATPYKIDGLEKGIRMIILVTARSNNRAGVHVTVERPGNGSKKWCQTGFENAGQVMDEKNVVQEYDRGNGFCGPEKFP